ncbi:hypothetical protein [Lysobacter capsici]|uniref:hypothetical protein n=1 Tax=Lysobacter capsici TaxID=435897 RepID=UPI000BBA51F9|nr:hypothetical protein [Lysobacter capsici]ATE74114.1 hypothetical protein CNO08_23805 [Lysobacter capsici]
MTTEFDAVTAQRLLDTRNALREGKMVVPAELRHVVDEILSAPLTVTGLVDFSSLSEEATSFARSAGMVFSHLSVDKNAASPGLSCREAQSALFELFAKLFGALTGRAVGLVTSDDEIKERMLQRVGEQPDVFEAAVNDATEELAEFYQSNAISIFSHAKTIGGMRLVTGGQRVFGPSALSAVRTTGLYADTQLIPDPIYPYFAANLHLNARHLHLALDLFHVLKLRPLVDAELTVPAIIVFPSFEEQLLDRDAHTKHGIEQLVLRVLGPVCEGEISSIQDVFDYAKRRDENFSHALQAADLFIPPGGSVGSNLSPTAARERYLSSLMGRRSDALLKQMSKLPTGVLLLTGVMERLTPLYHLMENAGEFDAQPLLSQPVHWHYFEKSAQSTAIELRRKSVLSEQAFQTLRAIQDDSLSWLAGVPVETLAELLRDDQHRWLRDELNKYTSQLSSSGVSDVSEMVREVTYGLASLVQRQSKVFEDIRRKYSPKKWGVVAGGAVGIGAVAVTTLLPALSPLLMASLPAAAMAAGVAYAKEKAGELVEKRQAQSSMLGVLASVRPR